MCSNVLFVLITQTILFNIILSKRFITSVHTIKRLPGQLQLGYKFPGTEGDRTYTLSNVVLRRYHGVTPGSVRTSHIASHPVMLHV